MAESCETDRFHPYGSLHKSKKGHSSEWPFFFFYAIPKEGSKEHFKNTTCCLLDFNVLTFRFQRVNFANTTCCLFPFNVLPKILRHFIEPQSYVWLRISGQLDAWAMIVFVVGSLVVVHAVEADEGCNHKG